MADRTSRRAVMVAADLARIVEPGHDGGAGHHRGRRDLDAGRARRRHGRGHGASSTRPRPGCCRRSCRTRSSSRRTRCARPPISGSEILGPALAGVLVAAVGAGWAIAVDAATFAISAVCLAMLRPPPASSRRAASFLADLREGWVAFRSRRWVWTVVGYFAVGEHDLGRLERARARPSPTATWVAPPSGAPCSRPSASGALAGSLLATRVAAAQAARARRVDGGPVRAAARLPGRRRPGAAARCQRVPVGRRADARHVGLGVDAPAPHPGRVALAGQRLRLVRLVSRSIRSASRSGAWSRGPSAFTSRSGSPSGCWPRRRPACSALPDIRNFRESPADARVA